MRSAGNKLMRSIRLAFIAALPALLPVAFPYTAAAQDPGGCFMVTSSGKTVSLGGLCGATPPDTGVFRVPIKRRYARTPVIDVTFNGNQTFEMILDTGASGTMITQGMANALNLKPNGIVQVQVADGSEVQMFTSEVRTVAVSGAVVNNVEVAIAPRMNIGLLGHNFFANYDVKILENVIEFYRR